MSDNQTPEQPAARLHASARRQPKATTTSAARRFSCDNRGTVALIFALCAFIVVGVVGGAVDFGRTIAFKGKLQTTLASASLAAGSA